MKKIMLLIVSLIIVAIGWYFFLNQSGFKNNLSHNSATKQIYDNQNLESKIIKIHKTGFYDTSLISDNSETVSDNILISEVNSKLVGQFIETGQKISVPKQSKIELIPTDFSKMSMHDNAYKINYPGNYFVGKQLLAGKYKIKIDTNTVLKDGTTVKQIQLEVLDDNGKTIDTKIVNDNDILEVHNQQILKIKGSLPATFVKQ